MIRISLWAMEKFDHYYITQMGVFRGTNHKYVLN